MISVKVDFEGELDDRNWVWDFGGMKRAKTLIDGKQPKAWMDYMFDHTEVAAKDDPAVDVLEEMNERGIIQLRWVEATGAEKFAEHAWRFADKLIREQTDGRCWVHSVECMEHGANSAIYKKEN